MTDLRQTKEFANFLKSQGWIIETISEAKPKKTPRGCAKALPRGETKAFIRKLPLTPFSIIKLQRPEMIDIQKINQLAKNHRALAIYIEPSLSTINYQLSTKKNGFHLSRSPFLPTKTIHLDLAQSQKQLLTDMKKDARYCIRKASLAGPTCKQVGPDGIKLFHQAWKRAVSWKRHVPPLKTLKNLKTAFGPKAIFLVALTKVTPGVELGQNDVDTPGVDAILAGTIILLTKDTAYYYYAFTSKEGRKMMAQYLLVWEVIKIAKKQGCKIFDFEGIYDPRFPIKNWQGFSYFKKSFGGKEVEYPGCFVKKRLPF